jgi:hypothetical protein
MERANKARGGDSRPIRTIARGGQSSGEASARKVITDLSSSVWAFSALACALEAGLLEALSEARPLTDLGQWSGIPDRLVEGLLDVLVSLGLLLHTGDRYSSTPDLLPLLQAPARDGLLADIRSVYLQSRAMIDAAKRRTLLIGWFHTDPELLAAQGAASGSLFHTLAQTLFPRLDGLIERLQSPTGTFLDVGTGLSAIAIQMCRLFPRLHVVGLEPQDAPLAEARRNVTAAKLEEYIELRAKRIEDLVDRVAFDLVWLPQIFLPREVLKLGLRRAWEALRPGGWILLIAFSIPGMDLDAALMRLTNVAYGGDPLYPEQVAELLADADFVRTQVFPSPAGSIPKLIVGQRPTS